MHLASLSTHFPHFPLHLHTPQHCKVVLPQPSSHLYHTCIIFILLYLYPTLTITHPSVFTKSCLKFKTINKKYEQNHSTQIGNLLLVLFTFKLYWKGSVQDQWVEFLALHLASDSTLELPSWSKTFASAHLQGDCRLDSAPQWDKPSCPITKEHLSPCICSFYSIQNHLTDINKEILWFGPMFVEYLLCKIKR